MKNCVCRIGDMLLGLMGLITIWSMLITTPEEAIALKNEELIFIFVAIGWILISYSRLYHAAKKLN